MIVNIVEEFNRGLVGMNTRFVAQPFMVDTILATKELISPADCFHPSAAGQGFLGRGLWINRAATPNATSLGMPISPCQSRRDVSSIVSMLAACCLPVLSSCVVFLC